jgi:hypothetical protein
LRKTDDANPRFFAFFALQLRKTEYANLRFMHYNCERLMTQIRGFLGFLHYNCERRITQIRVFFAFLNYNFERRKTQIRCFLRFCITIAQDGWRKFALFLFLFCVFALQLRKSNDTNLRFKTRLVFTHLVTQYTFLLVLRAVFLKKHDLTLN